MKHIKIVLLILSLSFTSPLYADNDTPEKNPFEVIPKSAEAASICKYGNIQQYSLRNIPIK